MKPRKTIGFRLLRYVFGCYFAIAVVVTSVQLISEYLQAKEDVFFELSHLGNTLEDSLARSLWNYNADQAKATLLGIEKIAMISSAKVTNIDGSVFADSGAELDFGQDVSISGQETVIDMGRIHKIEYYSGGQQRTIFEYKFPIHYVDSTTQTDELIGYCFMYADRAAIIDRVRYGFILIIVNSLIKTLALWFIFLFFAKRIVAKPMRALSDAARELDPSNPDEIRNSDELEKIYYLGHDDELHDMAESFIRMRNAMIEKVDLIEEQNQTLEQRVKDRTARIEEVNRELKHLSLHDPLTGLPNRSLFHDRLEHLLDQARRDNMCFAVASIDLTKFKDINDNFGHQAGDHVLRELAQRLMATMRSVDTVARMGGDEFAMLLEDVDMCSICQMGEKIIACAYEPIIFENESIMAGINLGFSLYPEHAESSDTLFNYADIAMYQAKKNDDGYSIYAPAISGKLERHDIIARDLKNAIEKDQFRLYYQPIVLGQSHAVKGVEALIRWQHPELGFIPPDEFIAYAERSNMIKSLTDWVLNRALADGEQFQKQGYDLSISVNISGRLVSDSTFPESLAKLIAHYDFPQRRLTLELTESSAMRNPQQSMGTLVNLKKLGVNLSIDDFGTGYSSFSYLARLPVDELKIDRSFLSDLDDNSKAVIEAIITLAHRLQLKVVAEGVENNSILQMVEGFSCDFIQGYHFCRPVPPEDLITWINEFSDANATRNTMTPMSGAG